MDAYEFLNSTPRGEGSSMTKALEFLRGTPPQSEQIEYESESTPAPDYKPIHDFLNMDRQPDDEKRFQKWIRGTEWFSEFKDEYGEEPNLDDPDYDYRAAFRAGIEPQRYEHDGGRYHWPSINPETNEHLKGENHPTLWMENYMQSTGIDPNEAGVRNPEHAFASIDRKLMDYYAPNKSHPSQPDYGDYKWEQGSPVDAHRGSLFTDTKAGSDRAAMAVLLAEELTEAGMPTTPSEAYKNMEQYSKELGWRGTLTPTEYYGMVITGLVGHGVGQAATQGGKGIASLLVGFGVFEGIGYGKGQLVRTISGNERDHYLADLMDPATNPKAKEFIKGLETAAEFVIGGKVAHKTYRGFDATISKVKASNWYRRATIRERGVMLSDMGQMIEGMKANGKTDGQILRQIRRTYGADSPQAKEAWEQFAVKTQRVPEQPKPAESQPTEKPTQETKPEPKSTDVATTEKTSPNAVVSEQKGQINGKPEQPKLVDGEKKAELPPDDKVALPEGIETQPQDVAQIESDGITAFLNEAPIALGAGTEKNPVANQPKSQPTTGGTTFADAGEYADMPPQGKATRKTKAQRQAEEAELNRRKAEAAKKESVDGPGTGVVHEGKTDFEPMEMPELVELHRQLMDGKLPKVMMKMKARGSFNTLSELTKLNANIFKESEGAAKTLAHEIGHIVDYLPDKIPGIPRGNILGRIVSANKTYRKHFVEGYPDGPHPMTTSEKAKLHRQVKKEFQGGERYIDELVTKQLKVTPDDVLAIWNSTMTPEQIKTEFPGLYDYVAKLDAKNKKALIVAAMKGDLPERVQKFAKTVTEKTGRKIKQKIESTPEEIKAEFRKAVMAEILARRLLDRNAVTDELKKFTHLWKPFEANADWRYTKYRYKPSELYADAFSALLTDPKRLESEAPLFYNSFLNFLERKPKFAESWDALQYEIKNGKTIDARRLRARSSMREKTAQAIAKAKPPSGGFWEDLAIKMVDKAWRILKDVHAAGDVSPKENPYFSYENWLYSGASKEGYQADMLHKVFKPLQEAGIDPLTFGEYLRYRREVGERHSMANPGGETQDAAYEMLKSVVDEAGPKIEKIADAFWDVRKEWFIDKLASTDMYSEALMDKIVGNEIYARFDVVKEESIALYGESFANMIHSQHGTLQDIADPFFATVVNDVKAMSGMFKMIAMRDTVKFYQKNQPDLVIPAKRDRGGRFMPPASDSGYGMLGYMEKGKAKAFYVPKNIARAFKSKEDGPVTMFFYNLTLPFRKLYVDYNLAFALKNPVRDVASAIKILPESSLRSFLPYWFKSFPEAYSRARWGEVSPTVRMMLHDGSLIADHEYRGRVNRYGTTKFFQDMFKSYDLTPDGNKIWRYVKKNRGLQLAARPVMLVLNELSYITQATEGMTKIAVHKWLVKNHPNMPPNERAWVVRQAGSPPFLVKGELNTAMEAIMPFYNPATQGTRVQGRAAGKNKRDYWKKTFIFNLGPRFLMRLAKLGVFGGTMAALMNRATEYDEANYNIIPLGMEGNKAVYFRIPQDEFARLLLNVEDMAWRAAVQGSKDPRELLTLYSSMLNVTFSNSPGVNPALELIKDSAVFITGGIPHDYYRGKDWFSEDVNRSQKRRWKAFLNGIGERYGLKSYIDLGNQDASTTLGTINKIPVVGPAFSSFVKRTDFGLSQNAEREWERIESIKGEDRLMVREVFDRWVGSGGIDSVSEEEALALGRRFSNPRLKAEEELYKAWISRNGNSLERKEAFAGSKAERLYYQSLMVRDPLYTPTDLTPFFNILSNKQEK